MQLKDESMLNFVVSRARDYFTVLAKDLARQTIEMDTFARSAQNEATNRDRLRDMIDLHLDSLTYINDVLSIMNDDLVRVIWLYATPNPLFRILHSLTASSTFWYVHYTLPPWLRYVRERPQRSYLASAPSSFSRRRRLLSTTRLQ